MKKQRPRNMCLLARVFALALAALGISGAEAQTYTDIHDFDTHTLASPQYPGILAQGRDGNLYGTAPLGGASGRGGVFMITPAGAYSVVRSFDSTMANPYSGLTLGNDGNFYGATYAGGAFLFGTVFRITPGGVVTVLHSFKVVEGAGPYAPPIQGADGNFYGTTSIGALGYGSVYKVTPAGAFTVLYAFDSTHGATPIAPLIQAKDGNFYGTTKDGGTANFGSAFKISPSGALTVLYNFDSTHGSSIYAPLVQGSDGNFYGTARTGGTKNNGGVVFKLTAAKKLTVLYNFDATGATTDGTRPYAGLIQSADGYFWGVTSAGGNNAAGTIFYIDSTGAFYRSLYSLAPGTGSLPFATLRQHTNGVFYGEATTGGALGHGTIFSLALHYPPFVIMQPNSGIVTQPVGILGSGLLGTGNVAFFSRRWPPFTVVSDSYVTTSVPNGSITGTVEVTSFPHIIESIQKFRVIPVVFSFSPASGPVGTQVVITGNSLKGTTKVTFGGVAAVVRKVDSYTQVTATVPAKGKTGKIEVTTPGGTATSSTNFTVN